MGLYEKIDLEMPEMDEEDMPSSSRRWSPGEEYTVTYPLLNKALLLLFSFMFIPLFSALLEEGFFFFQLLLFFSFSAGTWYLYDCLFTRSITFSTDRIIKQGLFSRIQIPTESLILKTGEQHIRFFHGSDNNYRESIRIDRLFVNQESCADIIKYTKDNYSGIKINKKEGAETRKEITDSLEAIEYHETVLNYQLCAGFFVFYTLVAFFAFGVADSFEGLAPPSLPVFPVRLACISLALAGYYLMRRMRPAYGSPDSMRQDSIQTRLKKAARRAMLSAKVASVVGFLGLLLLFLFGNMLDFYLFLLVGILYYCDCYPRFSTWQQMVHGAEVAHLDQIPLPRRSLHVSLVLMGALAVTSFGETRHYLYKNRQDCQDDWGDGQGCQEASSSYNGSRHYYRTGYGGGGGRPTRSIGVTTVRRGGFGSLGSFHASFGG